MKLHLVAQQGCSIKRYHTFTIETRISMKRCCIFLVAILLIAACTKDETPLDTSECVVRMKDLYKSELECTSQGAMEVNLYAGIYKNQRVYFTMTMCPSCNTLPPSSGYTCENKKVGFDDFGNVSDIKQVYNSCTGEFTE